MGNIVLFKNVDSVLRWAQRAAGDRIAGATGAGDRGAIAALLPMAATSCCT